MLQYFSTVFLRRTVRLGTRQCYVNKQFVYLYILNPVDLQLIIFSIYITFPKSKLLIYVDDDYDDDH